MADYWLMDWIEANELRTVRQAREALRTKSGRDGLVAAADQDDNFADSAVGSGHQLVAGHTMDLSGQFQCSEPSCMIKQVDEILGRAWHYFDEIVVAGLDSQRFLLEVADGFNAHSEETVLTQVQVALHVRSIGAEKNLKFMGRPRYCTKHLQQHAEECGYRGDIENMANELEKALGASHKLDEFIRNKRGRIQYAYKSDLLDIVHLGRYKDKRGLTRKKLAEKVSASLARQYAAARIRDAFVANQLKATLGDATGSRTHAESRPVVPGEVAFNLQLPMIESLPISEVLKIRADHVDEFHLFRVAVRKAIEERIRALPDARADLIADSVYEDILEPELIRLQRKLDVAVGVAAKRSLASAFVGSTITTVGLASFAPIAATGIAVAAGAGLATYMDWLKDRKDVQMSDLHFLLRLDRASMGHQ